MAHGKLEGWRGTEALEALLVGDFVLCLFFETEFLFLALAVLELAF